MATRPQTAAGSCREGDTQWKQMVGIQRCRSTVGDVSEMRMQPADRSSETPTESWRDGHFRTVIADRRTRWLMSGGSPIAELLDAHLELHQKEAAGVDSKQASWGICTVAAWWVTVQMLTKLTIPRKVAEADHLRRHHGRVT